MGAINPLFLAMTVAIGVPIYLHLFQRHRTRRVSFPALRYLERTEREHARQIRLRQILLLLIRVCALALLVGAGARLFFSGRGAAHPPTAVVVILDNSLSSGLVVGERRVLDRLKALAQQTLGEASDDDRFWVIRAGEPWLPALPGVVVEARAAIVSTEVSEAAGDLTAALERARRLLETTDLAAREVHLLSDLQRTAFQIPGSSPAGDVPVVVWAPNDDPPSNRALTAVSIGGGLPPLEGERTQVTIGALEASARDDTSHVPVRLVLNERIRGAGTLPPGAETTIPMPPAGQGWILGYADADPDDLRADDRRYFAFRSRPAPTVAVGGDGGVFVTEALAVLTEAGRVRRVNASGADVLFAPNGAGLEQRGPATAAVVFPSSDPTLLPALNRRLANAGIPWVLDATEASGEAILSGEAIPDPLLDVRVRSRYSLRPAGDPPAPPRVLAEIHGTPWAVEGHGPQGRRYLLLGSPMTRESTTLPVSTAMLRFLDWISGEWSGAGLSGPALDVGSYLSAPTAATTVRFPNGDEVPIDGTRTVRGTGAAGFYTFLDGDSILSVIALNPPRSESLLEPIEEDLLEEAIGTDVVVADDEAAWDRAVFRARQGPELWRPFLLAVVVLLLLEALTATSGTRTPAGSLREATAAPAATPATDVG